MTKLVIITDMCPAQAGFNAALPDNLVPRKNRSIQGTMRAGSRPLQVEGYLVEVAERFGQRLFFHQP
jgi:hypothetical protein